MPEFKNKEEYEKWKEQRIKELRESPEKIVNNPSNRTSANDENRVQDVMKKSFEIYEKDISPKRKRPCSLDEKVYKQILIPLIIKIEDDHKNGRI